MRLSETPGTLAAIRAKANRNTAVSDNSGQKSSFTAGKVIISFEEQCHIIKTLKAGLH